MTQDPGKRLRELFERLDSEDRRSLVVFAEFLCHRQGENDDKAAPKVPVEIPRPETETVPAALARLKASYDMLDASELLGEAAELMSQHVMQGREAHKVIDEMEALFQRHYQKYKTEQGQ